MSERDIAEQLNAALDSDAPPGDTQIRELAALARRLHDLPREDFRAKLKSELKEKTMATTAVSIREGFHSITPYLIVKGAAQFIDFVKQAFGAEEKLRVPLPDGRLMHAEVRIGDSMIECGDGGQEYPPRPTALHMYVPDADAVYRKALAAGATSTHEPVDQPYGDHEAGVKDAFGNHWYIATHLGPRYIPEGLHTVTPYLHTRGTDQFIEFLKQAFGAEEMGVYRAPSGGPILHAKIRLGDSILEMSEAHGPHEPMPTGLHFYVPDVDAAYRRAVEAGATPQRPPADMPYGERGGTVLDPSGNYWFLATPVRT